MKYVMLILITLLSLAGCTKEKETETQTESKARTTDVAGERPLPLSPGSHFVQPDSYNDLDYPAFIRTTQTTTGEHIAVFISFDPEDAPTKNVQRFQREVSEVIRQNGYTQNILGLVEEFPPGSEREMGVKELTFLVSRTQMEAGGFNFNLPNNWMVVSDEEFITLSPRLWKK